MILWVGEEAPAQPTVTTPSAEVKDENLQAYVELLRSDVRTQKVAVLAQLLEMNDSQDAIFWPIYREYEFELAKLNDERVKLIETYAGAYPDVSDAVADKLMLQALDLEGRRTALKAKYYTRVKSALSPKLAAQFLQIEHQLLSILDLQIAAALPIVK